MASKAKQRNHTMARKPVIAPAEKGYPPQAIQRAEIIRLIAMRLREFDFDDLVYIGRLTAAFRALYAEEDGQATTRPTLADIAPPPPHEFKLN
jgi:hypothetical protein